MSNFYCITLDSTPERTAHAKAQFERENVPINWVYGIDARAFAIKPALPMHPNPDGTFYYISPGACALVLSHYMAVRYAERDGAEDFVIFEDDVVLPDNFLEKLEVIKRECPADTLSVYLEYCCVDPSRMERVTGSLRRALPMCTAAVWYRKEAIPIFLKAIQPAHAPVDILLQQRACGEMKSCVTFPQMCFQATYAGQMPSIVTHEYDENMPSTLHLALPTEPPGYIY